MSPLNAAICTTYLERQKCYGPDKKILFPSYLLFILKKGGQIGGVMVFNATFNNISVLAWLSCFLEIKGQRPNKGHYGTRVNMVRDTPLMVMHPHTKYH
jgi:hypothetical protein